MVLDKSLIGLGKWAARSDWTDLLGYIFEIHVADACECMEMNYDEVADLIGEHDATLIWQCAFEDFLARHFEPDARNIVDDYLKRRDWKESATMTVETLEDYARERGNREIQGKLDLRLPRKSGSALQPAGGRRSASARRR